MDDQQQQRINRAAQEFTDALVAAYRTTADSNVVAQQIGAQQIEYFFNTVISNLRTQAEGTLQITQQLASQQQLAREATRDLTQVTTDTYMDLLDSVFSFYQGGTSRTRRRAEKAQRRVEEAEARAEEAQRRAEEAENGAQSLTLGLNWYFNEWTRAMLNWNYYWYDNARGTPFSCQQRSCSAAALRSADKESWEILSRLQVWF
jgi:hypothetical protein